MSEAAGHEAIKQTIDSNDVVLFMKGTKNFPQCGFSAQVAQILDHLGVDYKDVNVLEDMGIREGIKSLLATGRPSRSSTSRASSSAAATSSARCSRRASCRPDVDDKGIAYDQHG